MGKNKRSYSEDDKASALALLKANGGNITKTSSELNVPPTTLRQWRDGEHVNADVAKKRDKKEAALEDLFEQVARLYLARAMDPEAVTESKGKEAVIAAATAVDKFRLLKGEPTEVTRNEIVNRELPERAASAAAEALKRRGYVN